jgi:DNA-binding response OmpR family regulator
MKILLVEDDPFLIDIYSTKFQEEGFSVEVAKNGEEFFSTIGKGEAPDLVLLDIVLPEMDGWEILRKLNRDDLTDGIKIVILSNLGQREEVEKGKELGAVKYLIKSHYTPSEVVEEVKKILSIE